MQDNMGAPVAPDGLSSFGSSPQAVSPLRASLPSAGMFAVIGTWRYEVVTVIKTTQHFLFYRPDTGRDRKASISEVACHSASRAAAEKAAQRLTSARAERDRREASARDWFSAERLRIAAIAIETEGGDAKQAPSRSDESAISAKEKRPEVRLNTPERYSDSVLMM